MSMANAIFPARPLPVILPKPGSRIGAFLGFVFFVLLTGVLGYFFGPDLVRDYNMRDDVEPAAMARVAAGKCRSKLIIHLCEATIEQRTRNGIVRQETNFGFFDLHFGSYTTSVVQARGNPALLTTTLALDNLWNRILTAAAAVAFLVAVMLALLREAFRGKGNINKPFRALNNTILTPVIADIQGHEDAGKKGSIWTYAASGTQLGNTMSVMLPAGHWPFVLNPEGTKALAVVGRPGTPAMLVDDHLSVLGLTDEERQTLYDWRQSLLDRATAQQTQAAAG
jgi:hypothetical protein